MGVPLEDSLEEGGAGSEDDPVGLELLLSAHQGDINEVSVLPEVPEGAADVGLEVVPPEAELLLRHPCLAARKSLKIVTPSIQGVAAGQLSGHNHLCTINFAKMDNINHFHLMLQSTSGMSL